MTENAAGEKATVRVKSPVMARNDEIAARTQALLDGMGLRAANLMSSPGSGKTTLLEAVAARVGPAMAVIEGDVQTSRDADRITRAGCLARQIETRGACHLDAGMVADAVAAMPLDPAAHRLLVIENVGNMICPSGYWLGEHLRAAILSVPEGDDKVLKYPGLFSRVHAVVLGKIDLLPYLPFDMERAMDECRAINPDIRIFPLSARTGEGVDAFVSWLFEAEDRWRG